MKNTMIPEDNSVESIKVREQIIREVSTPPKTFSPHWQSYN